jgi:urease accessory protein
MKLLIPRPRGRSVWACIGSFGGGFVAGDETNLNVRLGHKARCFLTTQASTKIYRNPRSRPCSHTLRAELDSDSLFVLAPDPVQLFTGSFYSQRQEFHLRTGANLVLLDWYCSGRAARQERWSFTRLQSRNEIFRDGERVLVDSLLLDQADGPLDSPGRMGRFNCLAALVIVGPRLASSAARLLDAVKALPVEARSRLLVTASPIHQGAMVRLAGESSEEVGREARRALSFVPELLGDDPWARKW